jgi:hypothetical protein
MMAIRKVTLNERHLSPGRTKHVLCDGNGKREFPPFKSLVIAHYPGDTGYYLMHVCEYELGTDTWHETLDDALHQAEWEFEVRPKEWSEVDETF